MTKKNHYSINMIMAMGCEHLGMNPADKTSCLTADAKLQNITAKISELIDRTTDEHEGSMHLIILMSMLSTNMALITRAADLCPQDTIAGVFTFLERSYLEKIQQLKLLEAADAQE